MKRALIGVVAFAFSVGWFVTPAIGQNYNWTGLYLGAQARYQRFESTSSFNFGGNPGVPSSGSKDFDDTSVIPGGQIGLNWQPSGTPLVLGLEGDVVGADHQEKGEIFRYPNGIDHFDGASELHVQSSIRGRVGWAIDRLLVFGTGGLGLGEAKVTTTATRDGVGSSSFSKSETLVGWTVGGGIEYALSSHWLLRAEYRYTDLGSMTVKSPGVTFPASAGPWSAKGDFRTQDAIFGVNFKF